VHGYWSIDLDILITTATERLPGMVDQLRNARQALEGSPDLEERSAMDPQE
jgi:hypothetical protein